MHLNLQSFLNSHPAQIDKIGKWSECHKIYLTYSNKKGWKIEEFNIFQFLLKKLGLFSKAHLNTVAHQLKNEINAKKVISPEMSHVVTKIKSYWDKKYSKPFPVRLPSSLSTTFSLDFNAASKEVCSLLDTKSGMIVGEAHNERASMRFMIDNMALFKEKGVKTIFIEALVEEKHAQNCKRYFSQDSDVLPVELVNDILYHDVYHYGLVGKDRRMTGKEAADLIEKYNKGALPPEKMKQIDELMKQEDNQPYNLEKLFKCAKRFGIEIIPVDTGEAKSYSSLTERAKKFNKTAAKAIRKHTLKNKGKYVLICGIAHARQHEHIKGLNRRLNIPSVLLQEATHKKKECLQRDVEWTFGDSPNDMGERVAYGLRLVCS